MTSLNFLLLTCWAHPARYRDTINNLRDTTISGDLQDVIKTGGEICQINLDF